MYCIVRDKEGKKIIEFDIWPSLMKKLAKKMGIPYEDYLVELARIKVEEVRKRREQHGNARIKSKEASQENIR